MKQLSDTEINITSALSPLVKPKNLGLKFSKQPKWLEQEFDHEKSKRGEMKEIKFKAWDKEMKCWAYANTKRKNKGKVMPWLEGKRGRKKEND